MCLVGSRRFNTFGSHGSFDYVPLKHFETLAAVREYLKVEQQCTIFGIEIIEGALPVQDEPFTGNTAFILGNEVSPPPFYSFIFFLFWFLSAHICAVASSKYRTDVF